MVVGESGLGKVGSGVIEFNLIVRGGQPSIRIEFNLMVVGESGLGKVGS